MLTPGAEKISIQSTQTLITYTNKVQNSSLDNESVLKRAHPHTHTHAQQTKVNIKAELFL